MNRIDSTYTIQKKDFSSQPCPFCQGRDRNRPDVNETITVKYYSITYPAVLYLKIPCCGVCAAKGRPVRKIAWLFGAVGAAVGFLYMLHQSLPYACLFAVLFSAFGWLFGYILLKGAFSVAYKLSYSTYDVVRIITKKYKWVTMYPDDMDFSDAPPKEEFEKVFAEMLRECDCEIVEQ